MESARHFFKSRKLALVLSHLVAACVVAFIIFAVPDIRYTPIVEPTITDVDAAAFYTKYQKDPTAFVFLDVRSSEAYNKVHAVGSTLQPLHTLYTQRHVLPRNDPKKTIVLICSGGLASGVGFSYLQHYGFRNILRVEGGIESWQAKGLPIEGTDVLTN
jgi:rhodanese-related sulfurtransferase